MGKITVILGARAGIADGRGVAAEVGHFATYGVGETSRGDRRFPLGAEFHDAFGFTSGEIGRLAGGGLAGCRLLPLARCRAG